MDKIALFCLTKADNVDILFLICRGDFLWNVFTAEAV